MSNELNQDEEFLLQSHGVKGGSFYFTLGDLRSGALPGDATPEQINNVVTNLYTRYREREKWRKQEKERKQVSLAASTDTGPTDPDPQDKIKDILESIRLEVVRAIVKHPKPLVSLHEAHSVIREEFDEFWDEVKKQRPDPNKVREELIQTAAMCLRAIFEVLDNPSPLIMKG